MSLHPTGLRSIYFSYVMSRLPFAIMADLQCCVFHSLPTFTYRMLYTHVSLHEAAARKHSVRSKKKRNIVNQSEVLNKVNLSQ